MEYKMNQMDYLIIRPVFTVYAIYAVPLIVQASKDVFLLLHVRRLLATPLQKHFLQLYIFQDQNIQGPA